jgi:CRP/FNR family transcriptional regulator, cyclic AMP receptor protein
MSDHYVQHLAKVPLFAQCSAGDLKKIARVTDEIEVESGRELVTEGDTGHEAFVVVDGTASVHRGSDKIDDLGPGNVFGEMALIDRAPRNATVKSTSPMRVLVIGKREFNGLLEEAPAFRSSIMEALADRVRRKDFELYG